MNDSKLNFIKDYLPMWVLSIGISTVFYFLILKSGLPIFVSLLLLSLVLTFFWRYKNPNKPYVTQDVFKK